MQHQKHPSIRKKTGKMDLIEIEHLCFALPKIVKKMKKQATDSKKIFAKHISDVLLPKIYKGLLKLYN